MEVYVGNMLVKSRTANDHLRNLSLMFGTLKKYNMRLNPSKCAFGVSSGELLGFMISQQGIEANPEKIQALLDMQVPKTKKDVQSFTGRVAALACFISKATDRCAPFFKALKGSKRQVVWTSECDRAFADLKAYMSRPPLLSKPLPRENLIIYLSVEAINKIIKKTLKKKLGATKGNWPAILPKALWAINTSYRKSTGDTPFSLAFGTEVVVMVEVHAPTCRTTSYDPRQNGHQLALNLDLIDEHRSQAQLRNAAYKQRTTWYYYSHVKHRSFKVEDWVLRKVSLATRNPTDGTLRPF
ncbi:unnamed protein product [Prunus armeniaca]